MENDMGQHAVRPLSLEQHPDLFPCPGLIKTLPAQSTDCRIPVPLVGIKPFRWNRVTSAVILPEDVTGLFHQGLGIELMLCFHR